MTDNVTQTSLATVDSWREALATSFYSTRDQLIDVTPRIVGGVLVLVVGYLVAKILDRAVSALSESIGLQTAAERSGLAGSMKQVGIHRSVSWIVGRMVFWLTLCVFLTAAFNILHFTTLSAAMEQVVEWIPKLLVATVVVIVGLLIATFLRGVVATSTDRVGVSYSEQLANGCYYMLALMTFVAAFKQLHIEFPLLEQMILIAFGAVAAGFALAFGLGGREVMGGILAGYYTRQRLHAGDHVSVAGLEGTVREVGPVATVIETDENGLLNRHSIPNTKMLAEAVR